MPRILILEPDGYPKRAEELLRSLGEVVLSGSEADWAREIQDADVLVVRLKYLLDRPFLERAPRLAVIVTPTTGLDHIDLQAAQERGITVLSLRGETSFLKTITATAEHTWALLLALVRRIPEAHASVVRGEWDRTRFFGRELQGRVLGVVGLGRLGEMVASYGLAFRMRVLAHDPFRAEWMPGVERKFSLPELLSEADVVSIHVPLSDATRRLIGEREITAMRNGALLINTSRGAVLDESALLDALEFGRLGGAALDVIHDEYDSASALRKRLLSYARSRSNLILTPHIGGATHDSLERAELFLAEKLRRHLQA